MARFDANIYYLDNRTAPAPLSHVFVADCIKAMNPCRHPELIGWHVTTMFSPHPNSELWPFVTQSKDPLASDIVLPYVYEFGSPVGSDLEWESKPFHQMNWRGSSTGQALWEPNGMAITLRSQRIRLVNKFRARTGQAPLLRPARQGGFEIVNASVGDLNSRFANFAVNGLAQCATDEVCDLLAQAIEFDPRRQSNDELNQFRYQFDLDGNSFSGRFRRLMLTNSLVLKSMTTPEWHTKRMAPWVHYVPVTNNYDEVYSIMTFFEGDLNGKDSHDQLAKRIALTGRDWVADSWRIPDMQAYFLRILLE